MKSSIFRFVYFALITLLTLTACGEAASPSPSPDQTKLVILKASGSGTITTVLEAIKPEFEASTPGYKLEVLSGNSTGNGITGILEGVLDIATMARTPKEEEIAKNIKFYEMGLVGQAIITHRALIEINSLSEKQITDIFSGKITNWSELGGPNLKITVYIRDEEETSTKMLRKTIIGDTPFTETATTLFSQSDMAYSVEGTPGAIGIAAWVSIVATQAKVNGIAINGILPNNPAYPILDSAGLGYMAERETDIKPLLDWLSSVDGVAARKELGFVLP